MKKSILPNGFGFKLNGSDFLGNSPQRLKSELRHCGFLVVEEINLNKAEYRSSFNKFGEVIRFIADPNEPGYAESDIFELSGTHQNIVAGRGQLPFHADGEAGRNTVDHVFLYAKSVRSDYINGGSTVLCNWPLANLEMPEHLKRITLEKKHFVRASISSQEKRKPGWADWSPIEMFGERAGIKTMMIYLPFDMPQSALWDCRIEGMSDDECRRHFAELTAFYRRPRYSYRHQWKQDQMLVFDNRIVLHEREPYSNSGGERTLWRALTRETVERNDVTDFSAVSTK